MKKFKYTIIALLSGGMFLLYLFTLKINLIEAIILTQIMYIGLSIVFSEKQKTQKSKEQELINIIDYTILQNSIDKNRFRINEVGNHIEELSGQVKEKVQRVCDISEKIFDNLKKNPSNIREVKRIFSYYLDTLDKVLGLYIDLSDQRVNSNEVIIRLNQVEKILDEVLVVFEKYLEKSFENKILSLDVEIQLLQETMKMEVNI
jgi:5-bromo-4-chloroindolyl phosphate hydrolysis protein